MDTRCLSVRFIIIYLVIVIVFQRFVVVFVTVNYFGKQKRTEVTKCLFCLCYYPCYPCYSINSAKAESQKDKRSRGFLVALLLFVFVFAYAILFCTFYYLFLTFQ